MSATLPADTQSERRLIACCLHGELDVALRAVESVPRKAFFDEEAAGMFDCIRALCERGVPPNESTVYTEWAKHHKDTMPPWIYGMVDQNPPFALPEFAANILKAYDHRRGVLVGDRLMRDAADLSKPIEETFSVAEAALAPDQHKSPPVLDGQQQARDLLTDLERRHQLQGARSGIPTGFCDLDEITDGLQLGEFWVVGARPNVGKTAIALNVADIISLYGKTESLFVSLEMSAVALNRRLLSMHCKMDGKKIKRGEFSERDFNQMTTFAAMLSTSPFHILDSPGGIGCGTLLRAIRAAIRRWGIKVVFIDYLQKIRADAKGEKRTYEIGDITSALVALAKREKINIFALAQLNREQEKDKGRSPRNSDLADSKSIEADADFIGLLERPVDGDENKARLLVTKQRDGERGVVQLVFRGAHCQFQSAARQSPVIHDEPVARSYHEQPDP